MRQDPRMLKPFIRLGKPNMKGFNTSTVKVDSKVGARCLSPVIYKTNVNKRRINTETLRTKLAKAKFIAFPRLVISQKERLIYINSSKAIRATLS